MPHVLASITAHGLGHLAITAAVLERLHQRLPDCRVTVMSDVPEAALRSRIHCPFEAARDGTDFGLRMKRDLSVDAESTVNDYAKLHRRWAHTVRERAAWIAGIHCDILLSNVSYLNIAAARAARIPALALSPLNWADLYRYYAPATPESDAVHEQMIEAYGGCEVFLAPRPHMPMPQIENLEAIPPIAQVGRDRRDSVRELFGLDRSRRLILLALGGLEADIHVDDLPAVPGTRWLVDDRWDLQREDILPLSRTGLAFPDLLASSDLLVCKPGYGAFAEAACLGKPVIYVRRPNWPEESSLIEWLHREVPCREAPRWDAPRLRALIDELLHVPTAPGQRPAGADACVDRLLAVMN